MESLLKTKIKPSEISVLLSTNEMGLINMPDGSVGEKEDFFKALKRLEQMGLVSSGYSPEKRMHRFQRPMLTERGQIFLRQALATIDNESPCKSPATRTS